LSAATPFWTPAAAPAFDAWGTDRAGCLDRPAAVAPEWAAPPRTKAADQVIPASTAMLTTSTATRRRQ
jgi:hypothetical protein